jgi:glycosyltransferase involved in cell wall biosynthesis
MAKNGHSVRVVALAGNGLSAEEEIDGGVRVTRVEVDRRITSALRPLPAFARAGFARLIGLDPNSTILPAVPVRGLDRLRHPLRRSLELAAHVRRVGPWAAAVVAAAPETDVFQTQALPALPVVRSAARRVGGRFVYDFADYQTEAARIARLPRLLRAIVRRSELGWTAAAAGLFAVSEPMAELVAEGFRVARPGVLVNCPPLWRAAQAGPPASTRIRDALGLAEDRLIVLHHGQFKPGRGIEELLAAADQPALRALDPAIVLLGYGRLRPVLEQAARQRQGRLYLLPGVSPDDLLEWVASADVCYLGVPPVTLNQRLTIPNKLFESLMAGVPVVAAAGTEQARLVEREKAGLTVDIGSPEMLAASLVELLQLPRGERDALRLLCRTLALTTYNWEARSAPLVALYDRLAAATPNAESTKNAA